MWADFFIFIVGHDQPLPSPRTVRQKQLTVIA
jgi:hypothetical protein